MLAIKRAGELGELFRFPAALLSVRGSADRRLPRCGGQSLHARGRIRGSCRLWRRVRQVEAGGLLVDPSRWKSFAELRKEDVNEEYV